MKFGTSGLRGLVTEMTDAVCAAYATAFLRHLADARPNCILVGRDLRPSSLRIAAACIGAVRAAGAQAVDCGVLPTPALALEAAARGAAAIMVTGSHIPFDRNGLKFYRADGEITKADEAGVAAALAVLSAATPVSAGGAADGGDAARIRYARRAMAFVTPDALAGRRIGVWQHSAAGRDLLVETLAALGAAVVPLGRTDAFVPVDTEAVSVEDEAQARAWVAEHGLDALVSTDGDGDRPLIADETGAFLRGDLVGLLAARRLGADAVATPISSSSALERSGWIGRVARTRIGSPYVVEAMARLAADGARRVVGYEANGGFLVGDGAVGADGRAVSALPTRDALVPMLAVLAEAFSDCGSVSAIARTAPPRYTASDRLRDVAGEASTPLIAGLLSDPARRAALAAAVGSRGATAIDATDGARLTLAEDVTVHLRASGNAPELRCYAEAAEAAVAESIVAATLGWAAAAVGAPA